MKYLKCHDLSHAATYNEECGRCDATSYKKPDCKLEKQIYILCSRRKLKGFTKREDCPSYKILYQRLKENIDYGE